MSVSAKARDRAAENESDLALVLRAQAEDPSAKAELWLRYRDEFVHWVRRWNHLNQWEDIFVDSAASQLIEVLDKYRPGGSAFSSWAYTVARTSVLKQVRDLSVNHPDVSLDTVMGESLAVFFGPETAFVVRRIREEAYRLLGLKGAAVRGRFYEDKTDDQIAAEYGTTRRVVGYRRRQGLAEMAEHLRDVSCMLDCTKSLFPGYYYMTTDEQENEDAQPGGKEGE
ncbi:MAG TPA: sigma-70 family RNA polymerase sigma factor [bacterium]|nr:sigma-70 family RNA polymerase sigma factor [bacterium]